MGKGPQAIAVLFVWVLFDNADGRLKKAPIGTVTENDYEKNQRFSFQKRVFCRNITFP
jgi:hypothetical protein